MLFDVVKDKVHEYLFYSYVEYVDRVIEGKPDKISRILVVSNNGDLVVTERELGVSSERDILMVGINSVFPDEALSLSTFYKSLSKAEKELYDKHMEYLRSHDEYIMDYQLYIKDLLKFIKKHFEYKFYIHLYHLSNRDTNEKVDLTMAYNDYVETIKKLCADQKNAKVNSVIDKVHEKYYVRYGNINLGFDKIKDMFDFIWIINEVRMAG